MVYLNYAALSPTHPEAEEAVDQTLLEFKGYLYSEAGIEWYRNKVYACRENVAQFLSVHDPASIAFVPNASTAHFLILSSLAWPPGEGIITTTHENPSITRQLRTLQQRGTPIYSLSPTSPKSFLSNVEDLLQSRIIRAVVVSHVSHVDGRILPLHELSLLTKQSDCLLIIDGAQAVGHIPVHLNQDDYDIYFFTGHKWCQGPLGTGALAVSPRFLTRNSGFGEKAQEHGRNPAEEFEIGTHNIGLIAGLARACNRKYEHGLHFQQQQALRENAKSQLATTNTLKIMEWEGSHAPGILTIQFKNEETCQDLKQYLQQKWNIVAKYFVDYPEGDAPALRLSWLSQDDEPNVSFVIEKIRTFLR